MGTVFSNSECVTALQADGTDLTLASVAEVNTAIAESGLSNSFTQITSNIVNFGVPSNGPITSGQASSASNISFILAFHIQSLARAVRLSATFAQQLIDRIDEIWTKTDAAIDAAGFQMPNKVGTVGSIYPYNTFALPRGASQPSGPLKLWSRDGRSFFSGGGGIYDTVRARPEPLTCGQIISAMMEGIQALDECNVLPSQATTWLADIKAVIAFYQGGFVINGSIPIDPAATGTDTTVTGSAYLDVFNNVIPINQTLILLDAMMRYQAYTGDTTYDAFSKAEEIIKTVNERQFYNDGTSDKGFYYNLKRNLVEIAEDLPHAATTFRGLKTAVQNNVNGASFVLDRYTAVMTANAKQGATHEYSFYNSGVSGHGTTRNVLSTGTVNWGPMAGNQSFTGGSGGNGNMSFVLPWIFASLPPAIKTTYQSFIDGAMAEYVAQGEKNSHQWLNARMMATFEVCNVDDALYTEQATTTTEAQEVNLFLVEVDTGAEMLTFANRGWLSDTHVPYRARLIDTPVFRQSLTGRSAGYIDIRSDASELQGLEIHGHGVRFLAGNKQMKRAQFQTLLTCSSKGAPRFQAQGRYRLNLLSDVSRFRRSVASTVSIAYNDTAAIVLADIFDRLNADPEYPVGTYRTVGAVELSTELRFDFGTNDTADGIIEQIATSLNAWRRIGQDGTLEIVSKNHTGTMQNITAGMVEASSMTQTNSIDPVARVIVPYFNATTETLTGADLNGLDSSVTIDSLLKNQADAEALGLIEAQRYAKPQNRYRFDVLRDYQDLNVAEQRVIDHPAVSGQGFISSMEWRLGENRTRIELTTI